MFDNTNIHDDVQIYDNTILWDNVYIENNVKIYNKTIIRDNVLIGGNVKIHGDVFIYSNVQIYDNVEIKGYAIIHDNAIICDNVQVYGSVEIKGCAELNSDAIISSNRDYIVFKNWWSGGRYFTWTRSNNMWAVGCFYGTGEELIKKAYADSEDKGKHYEEIVEYVNKCVLYQEQEIKSNINKKLKKLWKKITKHLSLKTNT